MNKAMTTVNGELKLKIEELSRANSDFFNIMASTNVGVIFLDSLLQVRRFTSRATELFHLIESDIGRPFAHIAYSIRADALGTRPLELATQVRATAEQREEVVQGENGCWYILRLFPYRTLDNLIDGVVIILIDITERKATEEALRAHSQRLQLALDAGKMGTYTWHVADNSFVLDAQWAALFGQPPLSVPVNSRPFLDQIHPDDLQHVLTTLNDFVATGSVYQLEYRIYWPDGSQHWLKSRGQAIRNAAGIATRVEGLSWDITERKQNEMEEVLRASEAQLNAILYNMPASVYMLTTDHRYLMVNRIFEQENNITNAEIRGQSLFGRWPAAAAEILAANERQVLATKLPLEVEEAVLRGEEMHYYATIKAPLLDADDEPYAIIGISTDITARKRAEEALRQSEARYRTLFETMDEGFCIFEMLFDEQDKPIDYRFLEGNPAFARFTGLENAIGKTARELVPNLEAHWFELYGNVALTGEPLRFVQGSAAMGRWFEVYAFRFGRPESRQVALLFTNITERKQAEDQLRDQEELLRQIADNVPGLIAYIGTDERYRFVNAAFEAWFCRSRDQIIGGTALDLIGEDEHARLSGYRQQALAGEAVSYETDFAYPDGITRTVWGRYQPHFADDGSVPGFYLYVMDISERKAAEQALQQFNEHLEQQVNERTAELTKRLQELDQFAYVASHDLRAPLRAIDHLAQWIRDDAGDRLAPASLDHLEKMRGRIMRMENLLSDLLAYSRADRYQYNIGKVDVALLIDEITRLVTPPQGFAVNVKTALPVFVTYKVPLETVLRNLIHNAIKHHDRSDGQVQVTVQDLGDFYEFSVSDDGPGIAPKFHERIFQIFQTLKPRDQVEGSGMGLAIVKKAVEHYGGRVRVESDGQRGTTFAFTWPKEMPST